MPLPLLGTPQATPARFSNGGGEQTKHLQVVGTISTRLYVRTVWRLMSLLCARYCLVVYTRHFPPLLPVIQSLLQALQGWRCILVGIRMGCAHYALFNSAWFSLSDPPLVGSFCATTCHPTSYVAPPCTLTPPQGLSPTVPCCRLHRPCVCHRSTLHPCITATPWDHVGWPSVSVATWRCF